VVIIDRQKPDTIYQSDHPWTIKFRSSLLTDGEFFCDGLEGDTRGATMQAQPAFQGNKTHRIALWNGGFLEAAVIASARSPNGFSDVWQPIQRAKTKSVEPYRLGVRDTPHHFFPSAQLRA